MNNLANFYDEDNNVNLLLAAGTSTVKLRVTVTNWFGKWLRHINIEGLDQFDDLSIEDVTPQLFSSFSLHLYENVGMDSCLSYLSHFKMVVLEKFPQCTVFTNDKWYSQLRTNIANEYFKRDVDEVNGEQPSMNEAEVDLIIKLLLNDDINIMTRQGQCSAFEDRLLLIWDRHFIGRISETGGLTGKKVNWDAKHRCLKLNFKRLKNRKQETMHLVIHRKSWMLCPLHSLATTVVLQSAPMIDDESLFKTFSSTTVVKHVNSLFKDIFAHWSGLDEAVRRPFQLFTSHALRHGSVNDVSGSPDISFTTLGLRSGLSLCSFSNIFKYLSGGFKYDSQCARLFSEWYDVNCGGICPGNYYIIILLYILCY
jgi:hypothetical protein